jgi:hypothetical protein
VLVGLTVLKDGAKACISRTRRCSLIRTDFLKNISPGVMIEREERDPLWNGIANGALVGGVLGLVTVALRF